MVEKTCAIFSKTSFIGFNLFLDRNFREKGKGIAKVSARESILRRSGAIVIVSVLM